MRRAVLIALVAAAACRPDFDERESFVDRTRVLAVRLDPPEAKPGEAVKATVLVASTSGPVAEPVTLFAFCSTPKLLTENGSVSAACQGNGVAPIGQGRGQIDTALPAEACITFGPETSAAEIRPRDPDVTGGFYQPIRAIVTGAGDGSPIVSFGFPRLTCNLANAPADVVTRFRAEYRANVAPTLLPLEVYRDGARVAGDAVPAGARVVLRAAWRPEDAEVYAAYDPKAVTVVARRESMRVSWFTTGGSFDEDRTGRDEAAPESFTENGLALPSAAGEVHVWTVLRDARGGVTFQATRLLTR